MKRILLFVVGVVIILLGYSCKKVDDRASEIKLTIDSLVNDETKKPFNGVILIAQEGEPIFFEMYGYSDFVKKTPFKKDDQFVIGSVSKQFTATIVLQQYEQSKIDLNTPIRTYLPELTMAWADTVTVHHLLSHTHGITTLDGPTMFPVGSRYDYSQIGYDLLAKICEKVSGKSFVTLSDELFESCRMSNTFHPEKKEYKNLVKGYEENEEGQLEYTNESLKQYPAAGAFVSSAFDLLLWNQNLFGGKLLKPETLTLMLDKKEKAVRNHPIFGYTEYGYGITVSDNDGVLQYGQTGYVPGFVSMNFYYPNTKTSVIMLENVCYNIYNLKETFFYHNALLEMMSKSQLKK